MQKIPPAQAVTSLTERELEILKLVATGTSNKDIAQQLFISSNTVKVHLRNIFAKTGTTSRTEAAVYAIHTGIMQTVEQPAPEPVTPDGSLETKKNPAILRVSIAVAILLVGIAAIIFIVKSRNSKVASAVPPSITNPSLTQPALGAPQRWKELASLPTARSGLAVAVYEDQIYAIGGKTEQGVTGILERYDVATDTWKTLSPKPTPVTDVNAAVIGGQIYVPGGRLASGKLADVLESYDPIHNSWASHAALPTAISGYALAAFEGKLYVFGGWDGQNYLASVYEYTPDTDTWRTRMPMTSGRAFAGAAVAGGRIYVIGGYDGKAALASVDGYVPYDNIWSIQATLPAGRYGMGTASALDSIYIVGGQESSLSPLALFPLANRWQVIDSPPVKIGLGARLAQEGDSLFLLGGQVDNLPTGNNLAYQAIFTTQIQGIITK